MIFIYERVIYMFIKVFIISIIVFFVIDIIWLGLIANNLYKAEMGHLLSAKVNWVAAILLYIIFVVVLSVLVIIPGIEKESLRTVIIMGALFGLASYATYDLTNYATLKGFPLKIVLIYKM